MTLSFASKGAHPIISGAGDATELRGWYGHIPFPTPEQMAAKRAVLLAQMEEDKKPVKQAPVVPIKVRTARRPRKVA